MAEPVYRRVVIKLSGEYFAGAHSFGMDQPTIDRIAGDLIAARQLGVEIAVVVGGGNMVRGVEVSSRGVSRPGTTRSTGRCQRGHGWTSRNATGAANS